LSNVINPPAQPAAVTAPRLLRQEANPPGTTLYVEIDLKIVDKFGITAPPVTGIFIPDGYRPGAAVDLILYLHGFKAEAIKRQAIDQYWNSQRFPYGALREGANASGRNVILVAPTLGSHSEAKRLLATGGLDGYLSQVLSALAAYGPFRPAAATPALGSLILACHSGGGWPMRQLAGGSDRALALLRWEPHFDPLGQHVRFYTRRSLGRVLDTFAFEDVRLEAVGGPPLLRETLVARARKARLI